MLWGEDETEHSGRSLGRLWLYGGAVSLVVHGWLLGQTWSVRVPTLAVLPEEPPALELMALATPPAAVPMPTPPEPLETPAVQVPAEPSTTAPPERSPATVEPEVPPEKQAEAALASPSAAEPEKAEEMAKTEEPPPAMEGLPVPGTGTALAARMTHWWNPAPPSDAPPTPPQETPKATSESRADFAERIRQLLGPTQPNPSPPVAAAPPPPLPEGTAQCLRCDRPGYPAGARARALEGQVRLAVDVAPSGAVVAVRLVQSSGHPELDEAALSHAWSWRFTASANGRPNFRASIDFQLEGSAYQRQRRELPKPEPAPAIASPATPPPEVVPPPAPAALSETPPPAPVVLPEAPPSAPVPSEPLAPNPDDTP